MTDMPPHCAGEKGPAGTGRPLGAQLPPLRRGEGNRKPPFAVMTLADKTANPGWK